MGPGIVPGSTAAQSGKGPLGGLTGRCHLTSQQGEGEQALNSAHGGQLKAANQQANKVTLR